MSPRQLAVHFTIGALLGTLGALFLVLTHASRVHQLFWSNVAPPTSTVLFVVMCALTIATGASLTGVIFSTIEAERTGASKRHPPQDPR